MAVRIAALIYFAKNLNAKNLSNYTYNPTARVLNREVAGRSLACFLVTFCTPQKVTLKPSLLLLFENRKASQKCPFWRLFGKSQTPLRASFRAIRKSQSRPMKNHRAAPNFFYSLFLKEKGRGIRASPYTSYTILIRKDFFDYNVIEIVAYADSVHRVGVNGEHIRTAVFAVRVHGKLEFEFLPAIACR